MTNEDAARVKGLGFLRNRGTENFSGRLVPVGSVFTADELMAAAECAKKFGNGKIAFTTRMSAEIPGIPYEKIDEARAFIKDKCALEFGGTGARVRPIVCCKGTTCVFGCCDTQAIARDLHEKFYVGMRGVALPHKLKIAVGGCPNSCVKPSLNDFAVEAKRTVDGVKFKVYVGGTWGKSRREGLLLSRLIAQEEIEPLLRRAIEWYRENGAPKERLAVVLERTGLEDFEKAVLG